MFKEVYIAVTDFVRPAIINNHQSVITIKRLKLNVYRPKAVWKYLDYFWLLFYYLRSDTDR